MSASVLLLFLVGPATLRGSLPPGAVLRLGSDRVTALVFSGDGTLLAAAGAGVTVWDIASGRAVLTLPARPHGVRLAFSADGRTLAVADRPAPGAADRDGLVRRYALPAGVERPRIAAHLGGVNGVAFLGDGRLVTTGADERVRWWDAAGRMLGESRFWSPELQAGREDVYLVGGGIWRIGPGLDAPARVPLADLPARFTARVLDGRLLLADHDWGNVTWAALPSGKVLHEARRALAVRSLAGNISPDGTLEATASRVVTFPARRLLARLQDDVTPPPEVAFSPDGQWLASASAGGTLLWDIARVRLRAALADWVDDPDPMALAGRPDEAAERLGRALRECATGGPAITRLIRQLDDDDFETRERASAALADRGKAALPWLLHARGRTQTLEVASRLRKLLARYTAEELARVPDPTREAEARAALARIGTEAARKALRDAPPIPFE